MINAVACRSLPQCDRESTLAMMQKVCCCCCCCCVISSPRHFQLEAQPYIVPNTYPLCDLVERRKRIRGCGASTRPGRCGPTPHKGAVTRHTLHVTRHTSHVTRQRCVTSCSCSAMRVAAWSRAAPQRPQSLPSNRQFKKIDAYKIKNKKDAPAPERENNFYFFVLNIKTPKARTCNGQQRARAMSAEKMLISE
jgi:hypothetical protein